MRPELLRQTLKSLISIRRATLVTGAPGGGKTSLIRDVAAELKQHYVEVHLPTMPVEDFGVPDMGTKGATFDYKLPTWFPAVGSALDDGKPGVLCFDDRNQAGAELQKVLANIIQARNLHGHALIASWTVVSTGNREQDRAGSNRVLSHLADRETELEWDTNLDDSTKWMINHGVNPLVIAFLRFRPSLLHDFDPRRPKNSTPRSWVEGVSTVIGVVPAEAEYDTFKGAVGEGAAAEFVGFVKIYRSLPDIDTLLRDPDNAKVPTDAATLYAISGALASRATRENMRALVTYLARLPKEFSVLTMSMAQRHNSDIVATAAFVDWARDNADVMR